MDIHTVHMSERHRGMESLAFRLGQFNEIPRLGSGCFMNSPRRFSASFTASAGHKQAQNEAASF